MADHHQSTKSGQCNPPIPASSVDSDWNQHSGAVVDLGQESLPQGRDPRIYSKVFLISGSLTSLTHAEVQAALESRGALLSRRISKKTDYLIVGRKPGPVAVTARIYEIPILTEAELLKLLGIDRQFSLDLKWPDA